MKLYLENEGEMTVIGIAKPGSFIGVQALNGESVFPFSAQAMTDTEVCMKDINVFYKSNPFDLTMSNQDIADLVSTTPESVSRLISDFNNRGIISSSGKTIEILDANKLETLCKCDSLQATGI